MTQSSTEMTRTARFGLGQIVRHKEAAFRGVIVDVDAVYGGPDGQPGPDLRDQPFYRVLAMGEDAGFLVYAAEDLLEHETELSELSPADQAKWFTLDDQGHRAPRMQPIH
ncbi:Heat shock protein HspQ [Brevundimonas sp. NIBR10]|uniref:heat shock protein HspQ n=1 Tax=Brevundimonas sp. NIBR10 TaxID=3015997 RepID=UPI0022F15D14|nr:heat shock protein HspQ [Brevundimonas sp. NIBR10]WGM48511.1 Heat shock protein HspQ [Brevundimonas sp. NIBR10]